MSTFNRDILIRNISALLENKKVSQKKLGEILGMSQPNISKDLSPNDKKCFTLEQVVNIANYFGVSVDSLVGNDVSVSAKHSPRSIAKFLSDVLLSGDAKSKDLKITEWVSEVDYDYNEYHSKQEDREITYPAIYFPDYWQPQTDDESAEACQIGNDTAMQAVNMFLRSYLQILKTYRQGMLTQDVYENVVANLLSNLQD